MARGLAWELLCSVLVLCIWLPVWSWASHLACLWEAHMGVVRLNAIRLHEVFLCVCVTGLVQSLKIKLAKPVLLHQPFLCPNWFPCLEKNPTLKSCHIIRFHKYTCIYTWTNGVALQWSLLNLMLMAIWAVWSASAVSVAQSHSDVKKGTETISNPRCQAKEGWGLEQTKA